ncbi:MAG: RNA methyltransferase, partial [Shewanella sp.]
ADAVVYVPTVGCMNLAASVNVLLYDRLAKAHRASADLPASATPPETATAAANAPSFNGDALIRRSRDNNNRTRVKTAKPNR